MVRLYRVLKSFKISFLDFLLKKVCCNIWENLLSKIFFGYFFRKAIFISKNLVLKFYIRSIFILCVFQSKQNFDNYSYPILSEIWTLSILDDDKNFVTIQFFTHCDLLNSPINNIFEIDEENIKFSIAW